jgi:hypothetical protein
MNYLFRIILLAISLFVLMVCAASQPKMSITTPQQFYMAFRKAPDMETRKGYVRNYKDLAEGAFSDHIVRMLTDASFKQMAPVEYRVAITMGMMLANMYNEEFKDPQLLDVYKKIKILP